MSSFSNVEAFSEAVKARENLRGHSNRNCRKHLLVHESLTEGRGGGSACKRLGVASSMSLWGVLSVYEVIPGLVRIWSGRDVFMLNLDFGAPADGY